MTCRCGECVTNTCKLMPTLQRNKQRGLENNVCVTTVLLKMTKTVSGLSGRRAVQLLELEIVFQLMLVHTVNEE